MIDIVQRSKELDREEEREKEKEIDKKRGERRERVIIYTPKQRQRDTDKNLLRKTTKTILFV
jgi:hypothetical protein